MKFNALTVILFSLGLMAIGLVAVNSSSAEIDPSSVVGIWLFDDGTGSVAMDSSGNNNHGTNRQCANLGDGRFGGALAFDGTGNCVSTGQKLLNGRREFHRRRLGETGEYYIESRWINRTKRFTRIRFY